MCADLPLLTVAIPTYNRPGEIRDCLAALLAQTDQRFQILVLDNASPLPAAEALRDVAPQLPSSRLRIVRHAANVGGDANILRCFEYCQTPYVWVLGDDDFPHADAVRTILSTIAEHPGFYFYNFACELYDRRSEGVSRDLETFLRSIDSYSNVLFISTSVFDVRPLIAQLRFAYHYSYTMAPHVMLLIRALLERPAGCLLSTRRIVRWEAPAGGISWSGVRQMLGLGILLDNPLSAAQKKRVAQLVTSPRSIEYLAAQLCQYMLRKGDRKLANHAFDQIYHRLLVYSGLPAIYWRYTFYRNVLLTFPRLGDRFFRYLSRLTGRGSLAFDYRDPFQ
jgi:glycosyltransferase involved in cell wall biosynthesis